MNGCEITTPADSTTLLISSVFERLLQNLRIHFAVIALDARVVRGDRQGIRQALILHPLRQPEATGNDVAAAEQAPVGQVDRAAFLGDRWRTMIVGRDRHFKRRFLVDRQVEPAGTRLVTGYELRVDAGYQWFLLQQAQTGLQLSDVQWIGDAARNAVLQVRVAQRLVAIDYDAAEFAFDNLQRDDAIGHLLIGNNHA